MIRKIGLFLLSLWLFFALTIIITANIPICFDDGYKFIGFKDLVLTNIIPIICLIGITLGFISYFDFHTN